MTVVFPLIGGVVLFLVVLRPLITYFQDGKGLRRFPSPSIAGFSNWWLAYVQYNASRSKYVHAAHEKLGDVSGMMKDEFYETFSGADFHGINERSITNTRDRLVHARKRKFISSAFAQKNIVGADPIIHMVLLKLLAKLDHFCKSPPTYPDAPKPGFINLYKWINLFTYDAIGEIAFGKSFEFLDMGDDIATAETGDGRQYKAHIIPTFQNNSAYDVLVATWSPFISQLKKWTWFLQANKNGAIFMDVVNYKVRERLRNGKPAGFRDFFQSFMTNEDGTTDLEYSEILRESNIFIAAGNDTSATSMANAMFLMIKNPRVLAKLREEVDGVVPSSGDGAFHYDNVKDLKYLKACLDEALRRRPPVAMGLSREVPRGGAMIAGHFVQEGVSVSVPAWSIHHDPSIYSNPYEFKPERWVETRGDERKKMMDNFLPFSIGPRACIGRNLAYFEQQILVATLVHRYDFQMLSPDYELPIIERLNANPDQFWVKIRRRQELGLRK